MVQFGGNVGLAFGLSIAGGLSTCIGGIIIFSRRMVELASPRALSISLSLSAGVMVFISLVGIFGKCVKSYKTGFQSTFINDTTSCGALDSNFISQLQNGSYHCSHCDTTCEGHAWLATTATFALGGLIIFVMDCIVGLISPDAHEEMEESHLNKLRNSPLRTAGNKEEIQCDIEPIECEKKSVNNNCNNELCSRFTKQQLHRSGILTALAIGLHNIPDGVATYVGAIGDTRVGAALAIGIALHNIPEGFAVAAPLYFATGSRIRAFIWTLVSALAEPLGAVFAWLIIGDGLDPFVEGVMFGIVCGMMVTISFKELVPKAIKYYSEGNTVIFSILFGMAIMAFSMILFAYAGA